MPLRRKFFGVRRVADNIRFRRFQFGSVRTMFLASSVSGLGIYFDSDVSMKSPVSKTVSNCFAALQWIRSIRNSISQQAVKSLLVSLVLYRLDYGCATLAGLPAYRLAVVRPSLVE